MQIPCLRLYGLDFLFRTVTFCLRFEKKKRFFAEKFVKMADDIEGSVPVGKGKAPKLPKVAKVKNKAPASLQITSEQLLREAKERQLEIVPAPPKVKQNILHFFFTNFDCCGMALVLTNTILEVLI